MGNIKRALAFDFGASSGRAMLGTFDGEKIEINEVHRFANEPEMIGTNYYWDVIRLFHEIKTGLMKARDAGGFDTVGIDTWGVDFGYIDKNGALIGMPRHYRDGRNENAANQLKKLIPPEELYELSGIQDNSYNTVYQLMADKLEQPYLLQNAARLLMLPNLFEYFLTGNCHTEYSHASTSGLLDVKTGDWNYELIRRLGFPEKIFTPVAKSGENVGAIRSSLCDELMISGDVISVASHDTASAVAAVPTTQGDSVYISCGTWSLFGTELDAPNTSKAALEEGFTNEGGYGGKIRFLKNIMALWLIQQSKLYWARGGNSYSYNELEAMARECKPFVSIVDVDNTIFFPPGDIPARIKQVCADTKQPVPQTVGEVMRCIYDSIALKYRSSLDGLSMITGKKYDAVHMVGGGIKDAFLSQLAANVCRIKVVAGPIEATVIGNVAVQLIATGAIKDLNHAREAVKASFDVKTFEPEKSDIYEQAYRRYKEIFSK